MQSRLQEQILTPPQYRHTKIHTNTHMLVKGDFSRIKMPAPMFISVLTVSPEIKKGKKKNQTHQKSQRQNINNLI